MRGGGLREETGCGGKALYGARSGTRILAWTYDFILFYFFHMELLRNFDAGFFYFSLFVLIPQFLF
jgi:hypothetical protein